MNKQIEILEKAKERLFEKGWTKGTYSNGNGKETCLVGAISKAAIAVEGFRPTFCVYPTVLRAGQRQHRN